MNQANMTALIGAIAAVILAVVQGVQGTKIEDNHELTHERIDGVESDIMQKTTVQAHMDNFDNWQAQQDKRLDVLEKGHDLHLHLDDESFDIEESK